MLEIGLIGCGAVGGTLAEATLAGQIPGTHLRAILSRSTNPTVRHAQQVSNTQLVDKVEEMVALAPDLVFEAAGHQAVKAYGRAVVAAGIDLALMSVGALAEPELRRELIETAEQAGAAILIPSGAIAGLDVLGASLDQDQLDEVVLTSTKHPAALAGQPYIVDHDIVLVDLDEPLTVFDGSAAEVCLAFPKSTNIAAAVSLAGLGFDRTRVRIVADPKKKRATHSLEARGGFGEMQLTLHNHLHPENPRTSYLACLSAVAAVRNMQGPLRFI